MESSASIASSSDNSVISRNGASVIVRKRGPTLMRIENPFTLKVFQVFTGFGVGCGLGIGVGSPMNFGAIPMLNQVMSAASGATHAFSGVGRHVNNSLRKMGAKNVQAGIGCGVGFGHGFGVGLAVKPGVVHQAQLFIIEAMSKMMMKLGGVPNLPIDQGVLSGSVQRGMSVMQGSSSDPLGKIAHFGKTSQGPDEDRSMNSEFKSSASAGETLKSFGTRSEKIIDSFLKDPRLRDEDTKPHEKDGQLQSETRLLRMVLKHQQVIEELLEENEKLRQILVEDLKVPSSKFQASFSGGNKSPCADCFDCRRKQRKR